MYEKCSFTRLCTTSMNFPMASNSSTTRKTRTRIVVNLLCYYLLFLVPSYADIDAGTDTITVGRPLMNGEYLRSENKLFKLQFFSPVTSHSKYLGIFYNSPYLTDPVWVGNRHTPVPDLFVMLMIDTTDGLLAISYGGGKVIVSNSTPSSKNTSATILDNGNFVLRLLNRDSSINRTLWQSFDYPTDTLLPGMKLGVNLRTGQKWSLTSWTSNEIPASGSFTLSGNPNGSSQLIVWWQGNVYWTSGLWSRDHFNDSYGFYQFEEDLNFTYISDENEKYLTFSVKPNMSSAKVSIYSNGWIDITRVQGNGDIGSWDISLPICAFSKKLEGGCVMEMSPKCRKPDLKFVGRRGSTVDLGYGIYENQNLSLFDCELMCRRNCSCIAFASVNKNGTGCEIFDKTIWFRPLELRGNWRSEEQPDERVVYFLDNQRAKWWIWPITAVGGALILLSIFCYCKRRNLRRKGKQNPAEKMLMYELADTTTRPEQYSGTIDKKMSQVHLFSFESLVMATDNFSTANKLGEGGFGSVYKGKLSSGQEIAIKRLSRSSGQGLSEFKNEILLIAKLQHDNLVKILGCCVEGQEKILVYEYLPNRSLDFFIFDPSRRELLKWTNRMNIIEGVAQGILYLHKYSRLRVIHRDLKASNILLDQSMNPKISDFGMARIFGKQESEANTNRIVGTHGYMSPEYAIKGVFSVKTDIFSFGVLLLEIVSGKKNHGCYHPERPLNLIGMAWELWIQGRATELMDPTLDYSNQENEITRCIHVGLLCVQDDATDRPSMTDVISMLTNESLQLPEPKRPAFFIDTSTKDDEKEVALDNPCTNDLSISVVQGR